jgi:CubicO group peptidase (beta-lactamase class C family)
MTGIETFRGVALLQRGSEDLIAFAGGTTGARPDAECTFGTRFQIASVSKQFTAAALLLLAERGAVATDDAVHRWLDGCPASWNTMTVHHLLTHTAGLVHWRDLPALDLTAPIDAGEQVGLFQHAPLLSAPGERYSYSSPGYALLARIVERAADQPYASFLAQEIFGPLGLAATFAGNGDGRPGLADGHRNGVPVGSYELESANIGAGDLWSTARDLARWDQALAAGEILTGASRQAMFAMQTSTDRDDWSICTPGYGYGWCIGSTRNGNQVIYHPGDNPGFLALNAWFPRDDVRLVLLTNEETTDMEAIIGQMLEAAFPQPGSG